MPRSFLKLDAAALIETVESLKGRIDSKFPSAGLGSIAQTVVEVAKRAKDRSAKIRKRNPYIRFAVFVLLLGIVAGFIYIASILDYQTADKEVAKAPAFVQFLDAALETLVFLGGGAAFLMTIESRIKRHKLVAAIHELRSLAHIIDMHQLKKSPEHYTEDSRGAAKPPEPEYSLDEVKFYLDYCSELLAIVSKLAMLYIEDQSDPVVLDSADQIENLTTSLSRKIWQKLSILSEVEAQVPRRGVGPPSEKDKAATPAG